MKYLILASLAILLAGCTETRTIEKDHEYQIPEGLKDCAVYEMSSRTSTTITVMRCPNSSTNVGYRETQGKSTVQRNSIVVDGVTYVEENIQDVENADQTRLSRK